MTKRDAKRAYDRGRVFQRGATWWIAYYAGGTERRESSQSSERNVAVEMLDKRRVGGPRARATLAELFLLVERDYRRRELRSLARVFRGMAHLRAFFGPAAHAEDVTPMRAAAYADHRLHEKAARATLQYELRVLSRSFTLGLKAGVVSVKPSLPTVSVDNARSGCPSPQDVARVIEGLDEGPRELVEFLSITGWRRGEGSELRWTQVDFRTGELTLRPQDTKTKKARCFPFGSHPRLCTLLRAQRERASRIEREGLRLVPTVFFTPDGRMIQEFRSPWKKACTAASVPWLILHDLRRYAAVQLVRAGVSEHTAMALLGHKTPHIFRRYNILSGEDLAAGVARLATAQDAIRTTNGQNETLRDPDGTPSDSAMRLK